ncbi:phage integrase family protein [Polaromonas sp. JS666]|uniref:phage integrase family protein n=1 Tax=Polaromonas sp. (strain JS666 / ATCC BAA-500) TaxID=296591 RepID=UPI00059DF500
MKTSVSVTAGSSDSDALPNAAALAALRAWYEGIDSRTAVARYLGERRVTDESSRGLLGRLRRQVADFARGRHRADLAALFERAHARGSKRAITIARALDTIASLPVPQPLIGDDLERWLRPRSAAALRAAGIKTLADLTVRVPRRRRWWVTVPGLGATGARQIEAFFAAHPDLTQRARALVAAAPPKDLSPWENLVVPEDVDGSRGTLRAPRSACAMRADNDYQAVQAWLSLHESPATQRKYRKEAERLVLWAIVERGCALSSLATEDAVAYRAFLRRPTPRSRWVGPPRPRSSPEWRPFAGGLSARSAAHGLSVLSAMFRWLIEQRYVLANPFSGIKVRGVQPAGMDTSRSFSDAEWALLRTVADGLEWSYGWQPAAAQRLRFVLDFAYATGLRASELVHATLGAIEVDHEERWLHVVGKGHRAGRVTLPPLARSALDRYLVQRGLPTTPQKWSPDIPLIGNIGGEAGINRARLWVVMKRFFATVADILVEDNPTLAAKLRRATPHWMRHTHASHALQGGAELTAVRDNLRHSSIATTSIYLHSDEVKRARQMDAAFAVR